MRLLLLILIPLIVSCGGCKKNGSYCSFTKTHERSLKALKLSNDDALVLEVHYPVLLKKILSQRPLSVPEVLILHEIGISSDNIIHVIKYTSSVYTLSTEDVVNLQLGGVPFEVINYMIES